MQCANSIKTELELRWWENNKQGKNKVYANNAQCLTTKNPRAMKVQKREARGYTRDCPELGATGIQLNFTGTKNLLLWLEFSVRNEKCNKKNSSCNKLEQKSYIFWANRSDAKCFRELSPERDSTKIWSNCSHGPSKLVKWHIQKALKLTPLLVLSLSRVLDGNDKAAETSRAIPPLKHPYKMATYKSYWYLLKKTTVVKKCLSIY